MSMGAAPLDAAHWRRLSAALDELLDLDAAQRALRLEALRAEDLGFAAEVERLLAMQARLADERFLEDGALPVADEPTLAGQTIGAYTIERPLGAGGMGSVWLARRSDGRYEGHVAFKLLNLALLGRGGAARFAREGSALARLTHPNIARLLDAGVTAGGQPYLVLEHVDGLPIDRWCEERQLGTEARVHLVLEVLAAVAHAHRKLVLHRDLKPGNILVTAEGRVKLLDFGIAKLIDDERAAAPETEITALAGRAFTPDYAAPEQVEGGDVTTATDVYALGVLLFVLLSGKHPTARATDTPAQRLRSVVDTEPARLSAVAPRAGLLRGDLENICAMALKKAPAERYPGVDSLADDLRRWLAHEPVIARPDAWTYRSAKFIRRHRVGVAGTVMLVLALAAGVVGTTWQAIEAGRQREQALQQRDRAQALLGRNEAIVEFVDLMFTEAAPAGQAAVLRRMLERSEALIGTAFARDPAHQAEILRVLGGFYTTLDLPKKQVELLERARAIVERVPDRSLQARLACGQAQALSLTGERDAALRLADQWIAATDIEPLVGALCLQTRAVLAQEAIDPPNALRFAEAGLQRLREGGQSAPLLEATLLGDVGFALHLAGRNGEADAAFAQALEHLRAIGRDEGAESIRMRINRGIVRYASSDFEGGLELFRQAIATYERRGEETIPPTLLGNTAFGLEQLGRLDEALQAYERTYVSAGQSGYVGAQAFARAGQASVQVSLGRLDAARQRLAQAQALVSDLPPTHPARMRLQITQARLEAARGDADAALAGYSRVLELLAAQGAETPAQANVLRLRAELLLQRGQREQALADAQQALHLARRLQGANPHSDLTGLAWLALGRARAAGGDAVAAHDAFTQAQDELQATLGSQHPETQAAARLRAGR